MPLGRRVLAVPVGGLDDVAYAVRDVFWNVGAIHEFAFFRGHVTLARGTAREPSRSRRSSPCRGWSSRSTSSAVTSIRAARADENVASVALDQS